MKTLLLTGCALFALSASAYAFSTPPPPRLQTFTHLECVPVVLQPNDHSRNPVYKIGVDLQLDDSPEHSVMDIEVVHTLLDGSSRDRSKQYQDGRIWQTSGHMEWFWNGTLKSNTRLKMTGRIAHGKDGWTYEEWLAKKRHQEFYMGSKCHVATTSEAVSDAQTNKHIDEMLGQAERQ